MTDRFLPLAASTLAGFLIIGWGALFLIAPVWQPGYATVDYVIPTSVSASEPAQPININTAGTDELMQLNGIGEVKALAIIRYREQYGPFADIRELENVSGISARMVESWAQQITIDNGP